MCACVCVCVCVWVGAYTCVYVCVHVRACVCVWCCVRGRVINRWGMCVLSGGLQENCWQLLNEQRIII